MRIDRYLDSLNPDLLDPAHLPLYRQPRYYRARLGIRPHTYVSAPATGARERRSIAVPERVLETTANTVLKLVYLKLRRSGVCTSQVPTTYVANSLISLDSCLVGRLDYRHICRCRLIVHLPSSVLPIESEASLLYPGQIRSKVRAEAPPLVGSILMPPKALMPLPFY